MTDADKNNAGSRDVRRQVNLWTIFIASAVLLVTGFRLIFDDQWVGIVHVVVGFATLFARIDLMRPPR